MHPRRSSVRSPWRPRPTAGAVPWEFLLIALIIGVIALVAAVRYL